MTEFCDQVTSIYLSTTAQHIKTLNRSSVQIYTLHGFSLSFFEIITQPFPQPVWRQPAATSSAGRVQNREQPRISAHSKPPSMAWPWGTRRQLQADIAGWHTGYHQGAACAALGHLWVSIRNRIIKDLMANLHQSQHHHHPNALPHRPTHALCTVDFHWNPPQELALLILDNCFNPPAPVSRPNILLWSLDYTTGSVCKTSTKKVLMLLIIPDIPPVKHRCKLYPPLLHSSELERAVPHLWK